LRSKNIQRRDIECKSGFESPQNKKRGIK